MHSSDDPPAYSDITTPLIVTRPKSRQLRLAILLSSIMLLFLALFVFILILPRNVFNMSCYWANDDPSCWNTRSKHTVILISMDGFRHDYIEMVKSRLGPNALPNFDRLMSKGVRALESFNGYPTITMPNHRLLVTGLYPQHHGVVGNNMQDTKWPGIKFEMGNQTSLNEDPWIVGWPEPIWATLQKSGGLAGSLLWPLTDQPYAQDRPFQLISQFTMLDTYLSHYGFRRRVQDLIWWLDNPHFHLNLILAYFDEPDETGHEFGPNSEQVARVVQDLDQNLGYFLDELEQRKFTNVDIILTADHGMSEISKSRLIGLDQYVNVSWFTYTQLSTMGFIYPIEGKAQEVYQKLKGANPHMSVYWLSEVPDYLHFNINHSRMPPLVLVPDPLWSIVLNASHSFPAVAGNHGYSTNFSEMHPFFIASGPSFRTNKTVSSIHAVDIYPLMCGLLRIKPNPNNGSLSRIAHTLLKAEAADRILASQTWFTEWVWLVIHLKRMLIVSLSFLLITLLFSAIILTAARLKQSNHSWGLGGPFRNRQASILSDDSTDA